MTTVHTCSYSCTRPECVLAQRDELLKRAEQLRQRLAECGELWKTGKYLHVYGHDSEQWIIKMDDAVNEP